MQCIQFKELANQIFIFFWTFSCTLEISIDLLRKVLKNQVNRSKVTDFDQKNIQNLMEVFVLVFCLSLREVGHVYRILARIQNIASKIQNQKTAFTALFLHAHILQLQVSQNWCSFCMKTNFAPLGGIQIKIRKKKKKVTSYIVLGNFISHQGRIFNFRISTSWWLVLGPSGLHITQIKPCMWGS